MISDDPFTVTRSERRPRWRAALLIGTITFLAGLGVMALIVQLYPRWLPWTTTAPAQVSGAARPARIAGNTNENATPDAADYDALAAREAALAARLSDLEARAATIDTQATAASGNATRAEGLLVAFAARRALDRGLGLGYIEGQLRERFGATQPRAVATVIRASRAPVTLEDLRLGLDSIGPDLVSGSDNDDWWTSLRSSMSNLIVLRKAGSPSPRPNDRLTRARHLLEGGQVEAALAEIAQLPGVSKAQRWTLAARRYIDARRALDVIETAAIIGQAAQPAPPGQTPNDASATTPQAATPQATAPAT